MVGRWHFQRKLQRAIISKRQTDQDEVCWPKIGRPTVFYGLSSISIHTHGTAGRMSRYSKYKYNVPASQEWLVRDIWVTSARRAHGQVQRPMRLVATGSALQVAISSSYHDIVAPTSAVGRLLLQARLPGTRCQTISVIRRLANTLLGDYWRHTCLRCTSVRSALEAFA